MKDIEEQVRKLKGFAEGYAKCGNWHVADTFKEAADTIESLYSELQAVNASHKQAGGDYKQQMMERFLKVD